MFNQTVLLHFQYFIALLSKTKPFYKRFIFDENTNDIVTLHGLKYETGDEYNDANDRNITIVGSKDIGYQQAFLMCVLQRNIHFKMQISTSRNWQTDVLVGLYDMNLLVYSTNLPYQTLHPTISDSDHLFVANMGIIGTPTYFIELFDVYLWMAFLTSFTLIGLFSTLGIYLLKRYTTTRFDYLTWFSLLTNQGGDENSRLQFPKILLVSLSIIAIIFHGSFGSFLSSSLAIRNPDVPFSSFAELLLNPEYSICVPYGMTSYSYVMGYFKSDVVFRRRVNNQYCPKQFSSNKIPVQNLQIKNFCPMDNTVFLLAAPLEISNEQCHSFNFIALNEKFSNRYNTILVSPGFKYREQFNRGLIRLRTAGFFDRFKLQIRNERHGVHLKQGKLKDDPRIDFHQTKYVLLIPVIGIVLGTVILIVELLIKHY